MIKKNSGKINSKNKKNLNKIKALKKSKKNVIVGKNEIPDIKRKNAKSHD